MKFICGSCRTKYQISDQKVRGKILTIRCKKCGAKIVVKESLAQEGRVAIAPMAEEARKEAEGHAQDALPMTAEARGRAASGGALSSAFEVAMRAAAHDLPTTIAPAPGKLEDAGVEWYIAHDGIQDGPFAYPEIVRRIREGEAQPRHYAWRDGFDGWKRIREVPDLAMHLPRPSLEKRSPPPPPIPEPDPEGDTEARDNVVDLARKRAEWERRGLRPSSEPAAPAPEPRAEQERAAEDSAGLEAVLDGLLPSPDDAATTPEPARSSLRQAKTPSAAFSASVGTPQRAASVDDFFAQFASSDSGEIARESTRFLVQAAGVGQRKSRNRIAFLIGTGCAIAVLAFFGLWATGVIELSLPGLGNPFDQARRRAQEDQARAELSDEEREELERALKGDKREPKKRAKPRRSKGSGSLSYVDDADGRDEGGGIRGDSAEAAELGIDMSTDGTRRGGGLGDVALPNTGVAEIPLAETGRLEESMITGVVNAQRKAVSICYQRALKGNQDLSGKLEFEVWVEPSGDVSKANVRTAQFQGTELARCISEKIKEWKFPAFKGARQQVVIPFHLQKSAY